MAVYYLDTSALVKRYVREVGTAWVLALSDPIAGNDLYIVRITGPEMIAALFRKVRTREMALDDASRASTNFRADFSSQYHVLEITAVLVERAMTLAQEQGLRGYDAIQLAGASELHTLRDTIGLAPLTFVSADGGLNRVAELEGLTTDNPNSHN